MSDGRLLPFSHEVAVRALLKAWTGSISAWPDEFGSSQKYLT
jgi:hypothetical protein